MSSKINGVDGGRRASIGAGRAVQRPQDAVNGATTTVLPSSGSTGEVQITGAASQLAALEQALRDLPVVDEARVAAVRTAIDQGSYQVVPQQIADRLMQLEHAFNGLPSGEDTQQA